MERPEAPAGPTAPRLSPAFFRGPDGWPYLLVPLIPAAIVLELAHAEATIVFAASALGIVPTAALMGRATEELAARSGPGIGGLLNVTFGNAPELIIALFALNEGLQEVVKASIIGSILGNVLLVMGAAMFFGGLRRDRQTFNATGASVQSTMLMLAATAMMMPAIFELVEGKGLPDPRRRARQLRLHGRAPLPGHGDRPDAHLRRRPALLAEDPSRHLQPALRGGRGHLGLVGPHLGDRRSRSPASRSA